MTAHELRKHLGDSHQIVMWGGSWGILVARHEVDHRDGVVDHAHDAAPAGDG